MYEDGYSYYYNYKQNKEIHDGLQKYCLSEHRKDKDYLRALIEKPKQNGMIQTVIHLALNLFK